MSMRRIDFPMDPSDFHDFYRLRPFLSLKMWTFGAIFLRMLVYHNPSDSIGIIPPIFLSLKMWTFGAIPIVVRDTGH